jgi:hypothetical protein
MYTNTYLRILVHIFLIHVYIFLLHIYTLSFNFYIFNALLHIFNKYLDISICGPQTDTGKNTSKSQVKSYPSWLFHSTK